MVGKLACSMVLEQVAGSKLALEPEQGSKLEPVLVQGSMELVPELAPGSMVPEQVAVLALVAEPEPGSKLEPEQEPGSTVLAQVLGSKPVLELGSVELELDSIVLEQVLGKLVRKKASSCSNS